MKMENKNILYYFNKSVTYHETHVIILLLTNKRKNKMSKSKIRYEWHSLELDNNQDIINITIHDNFIDAMNDSIDVNDCFENGSVELVKYYMDGYDIDGETRSAWCANSLDISDLFDDGSDIPKYLKKQIINEVRTWGCGE